MQTANIELIGDDDSFPVSGIGFGESEGIKLAEDPEEIFDTDFSRATIPAGIGGRLGRTEVPVRHLVLPFNITGDVSGGNVPIEAQIARFRKLWGSHMQPRRVKWLYTSEESGSRWLWLYLESKIKFNQKRDWNLDGFAKAVVQAVAVEPRYESTPLVVKAENPSSGTHTVWLPVWNPTDQEAWPDWSLDPKGTASFSIADFSFGHEQDIDVTWTPGQHANRMVALKPISVPWSVRPVRSGDDPYVAADLSNASGLMGGVFPLYSIPPYTGTQQNPVLLPVTINGPAGAEARLTLRRFWSAESGLE
ncbi:MULTISPECIES: hypothetical protein [Gordonia]|uniref:Minor tail protein n=1 Tax=Gordonia sihwensis NBRC 108236 TaxID=1223544 RepID=L7LMT4_9ACTN|nr:MULTISPECIES: hypothetical protein [Gordonia]AUH68526.1 hypothetical protein CXX93_09375 [Gordonia sp. YC-JH1]GAC62194.1 hypothetical protein GSI01S_30_00020 [Gordonia sihwensis NBRC 108236]